MLTGEKVTLRALHDEDLPALYEIHANLDNWEERTDTPPGPLTRAQFDERQERRADSAGSVVFAITVDERFVGTCMLTGEDTLARHASVGINLALDSVGKGYGSDALRVLIDYAFTRRNLRRLHLIVIASNERAMASYRKVGFVEEGRRREHCWVRGAYVDEVVMGLLRSDWRSTNPG